MTSVLGQTTDTELFTSVFDCRLDKQQLILGNCASISCNALRSADGGTFHCANILKNAAAQFGLQARNLGLEFNIKVVVHPIFPQPTGISGSPRNVAGILRGGTSVAQDEIVQTQKARTAL